MARPRLITAFGVSKTATEWARDPWSAVSVNTLKARLATGVWSIEAAISTPPIGGRWRPGVPLSEAQEAELREAAGRVRQSPKVHRNTPPDAPEIAVMRARDELIRAAIERGTTLLEIGRAVGLSGVQVAVIRDANP